MQTNIVQYSAEGKKVLGAVRIVAGQLEIDGHLSPDIIRTIETERAATQVSHEAFLIKLTTIFAGRYVRAEYVR